MSNENRIQTQTSAPQAQHAQNAKFARRQRYIWVMRFLGLTYAFVGALFFFFPNELFYLVNVLPNVFKIAAVTPNPSEHFWLVLATSMMMMLSALSFLASFAPDVRGYGFVHMLSKITSTAGFIYFFLNDRHFSAYLVGFVTDGSIAILVSWITLRPGEASEPAAASPLQENIKGSAVP